MRSSLLKYPWRDTEAALEAGRANPDPHDDVLHRYTDPDTGGPVLPMLDANIQLLQAGVRTQPHRHVHSVVYQVFRGRGETIIDGVRFAWERGDMFALPPWAAHEHHAVDGDALLFSITDGPVPPDYPDLPPDPGRDWDDDDDFLDGAPSQRF